MDVRDVPILFIVFNRPDTAAEVFEQIRKIKPKKLFIAADGPRPTRPDDIEKCAATREIVKNVDWDCEVKTLFRESNLGCKMAVSSGINWFFENVEEGIILEDDCLPNESFFKYAAEMLERYESNERIMMVAGANFQEGNKRGNASYYFTQYPHIWGWASWRRAWQKYDLEMKDYPTFIEQNMLKNLFPNDEQVQEFWKFNFDRVHQNELDTWDYQWVYTILKNDGLTVAPNVNMISNIGFRPDATHTDNTDDKAANNPVFEMEEITHPGFIIRDVEADEFSKVNVFSIGVEPEPPVEVIPEPVVVPSLQSRIKNKIKRIINKQ